jgi:hypothetical protein
MSQGSLGKSSELVELDDEFEITEINDDNEELQELLEDLGDPSLLDPLSETPSQSQSGMQKIESLNKALNKQVPLQPRSNSNQGKKPKLVSLKGQEVATDPLKTMLGELDTLKKSNEQNRVTAKFLSFTKSDFEKKISDPLKKFLAEAEEGVKTKTPMPTTVYEEQFLPIYNAIRKEIEDQKEKAKNEKPPKSDEHLYKGKCAENLMVTLRTAFKLWKGQETERARIVIADMEENGQLDYLKTQATDKELYSRLKGDDEAQKELRSYVDKLQKDPCVLRGVVSKLISAKKPGRGPELVYDILSSR